MKKRLPYLLALSPIAPRASEGCAITDTVVSLGCLSQIVANLVTVSLMFLGLITLLFLLWGAFQFVISKGDPKAIEKARGVMTYAVIGAALVLGSFVLLNVVFTALNVPNPITNFSFFQRTP